MKKLAVDEPQKLSIDPAETIVAYDKYRRLPIQESAIEFNSDLDQSDCVVLGRTTEHEETFYKCFNK